MIVVLLNNIVVCMQKQIDDYLNPMQQQVHTLERYRRTAIYSTIQVHFRRRAKGKRLYRHRIPKLHQLDLLKFISSTRLNVQKVAPLELMDNQIPLLSPNNSSALNLGEITTLTEGPFLHSRPYMHLSRFNSIQSVVQEDFCNKPLLTDSWKYYQELDSFTGLFQDMIILNSLEYWNTIETEIRAEGFHPKGFTILEFIKWELLRHSTGITSYSDAHRIFQNYDPVKLRNAFERPDRIPAPYHASYYYSWLKPIHFRTFLRKLVEDCVTFKIIIPRIAIADGLIFRTWAGNFTLDRWMKPTDLNATITVHNKKMLGKCYNAVVFYAWCGSRWLPVDLYVITGSANENSLFQPLVAKFLEASPFDWDVFLYDTGACSAENREYIKNIGIISGITARSNIKNSVVLDVGHKRFCFADDIPDHMSLEQYKQLLNHRSQIEAGFSGFTTYHHMKQMNTMGQEAAEIHVLKYLILQLLHAIAAYKVNRPDLLMMYSAFSALN